MKPDDSIEDVKGVGESLAKKYAILGIKTVNDLVEYYPRRYDDYSSVTPIAHLRPAKVCIRAKIKQVKGRYVRRGMHITEAIASDSTGSVRLIWFNQPYRAASIKAGSDYLIIGEYALRRQHFSITNPSLESVTDIESESGPILAIYRETKGLNSRAIRRHVKTIFDNLPELNESLPESIIKESGLLSHDEATRYLHEPPDIDGLSAARRSIGFEEIFYLSLASLMNKLANQSEKSVAISFNEELAQDFSKSLPFKLTDSQRIGVMRIYKDLEKSQPMNRLLEGDVGSGKTVVAAMAALMALNQGWQVALMAPTELLAKQHAATLEKLLKPLNLDNKICLLIGSMTRAQKTRASQAIKSGLAGLLIGTQALIQEGIDMHKLALVIIDEQHRFGVEQREKLLAKAGHMPHVLIMTATPIPRTLMLTVYGELDISMLNEKPLGRKPIITKVITPSMRPRLIEDIKKAIDDGRQVYVVCPLITQTDESARASVEAVYARLKTKDFKRYRVGILHGKLKAAEKDKVMQDFISHKIDILVSTTVIEVGVDVANASVMMIENAERFGLAQLHQLRGRVGRSDHQSHCYLMLSDDATSPTRRLRAMENTTDGFKLAELDLEIRGPGAIYGRAQHGALDLRIANLSDTHLIAEARVAAQRFLDSNPDLIKYPNLQNKVNRLRAITNLN